VSHAILEVLITHSVMVARTTGNLDETLRGNK